MFKNNQTKKLLVITVLIASLGLAACSTATNAAEAVPQQEAVTQQEAVPAQGYNNANESAQANGASQNGNQGSGYQSDGTAHAALDPNAAAPTDAEIEGLLYMREEEKLARDVYLTLYEQWNLPIFQNIAKAEQMHTDAVKSILDLYAIEDPVTNDEIGVFTNPDLQSLYNQLVEQGSQSVEEALKVGLAIEEIDILDLKEYMAETDNPNIQQVYQNLMMGSENHLRAFVGNYQRQTGETYAPQYLTPEEYQAIVSSGNMQENGGGYGQGKGQGKGQGGGRRNSN